MKIQMKISITLVLDFNSPVMTEELARHMADTVEFGWRTGAAKDVLMVQEVYRQQFGGMATIAVSDVFFDTTIIK